MIELQPPVERALLVAAPLKARGRSGNGRSTRADVEEHLAELGRLVDTAGAKVVGKLTQQIDRPNPATFLGSGKIAELRELVEQTGATLVVFDDELTPTQGKNIEDITGRRVMDRAEVILDIFATRARSSEAKMQVELAQLEYMLPRLTRMWASKSGPGQTPERAQGQFRVDRTLKPQERLSGTDPSQNA